MANNSKQWIDKLLNQAGITVNGSNPWDIKINNPDLYDRVKSQGSLGLAKHIWTAGGNANDWTSFSIVYFSIRLKTK